MVDDLGGYNVNRTLGNAAWSPTSCSVKDVCTQKQAWDGQWQGAMVIGSFPMPLCVGGMSLLNVTDRVENRSRTLGHFECREFVPQR